MMVAVQDELVRAEVVGLGILLQLMRLMDPVLGMFVIMMVVMELHVFRFFFRPLPFVGQR